MKVLLAEDDPVSRHLVLSLLKQWGYEVIVVENGADALEILQSPEAPQLVISDWMMPQLNGIELCERIRSMERSDYIYFILLTVKGQRENVVRGLKAGADDYVFKPFDPEELKCRIEIGERIIRLERKIVKMARTDGLTGVLNRRAFMERFETEMRRAERQGGNLALIFTDIDHFKKVNDTYGHQAGDAVLTEFSDRLSKMGRAYDFIGRYGGEEFAICLPGTNGVQAVKIAERIRVQIENASFNAAQDHGPLRISASFGVTAFDAERDPSIDQVIQRADRALYQAKNEGRNRVVHFASGD